jgi:hypothetical protein
MGLLSSVFGSGSETKTKSSANYSNQTGPLLGLKDGFRTTSLTSRRVFTIRLQRMCMAVILSLLCPAPQAIASGCY